MNVVGANEEITQAAFILTLDATAEIRSRSISMVEMNRTLLQLTDVHDHNWRARLLPKGDFIVNFPLETAQSVHQ